MPATPGEEDFISLYLRYTSQTECPTFFHRWCAITSLAAYLERRPYYIFGHGRLHANLYTMLIGIPGTRKTTAITMATKLLRKAGYYTFAAQKTRQEKFLLDMAELGERLAKREDPEESDILDRNNFGNAAEDPEAIEYYEDKPPVSICIAADEFNIFIGQHNTDFVSILGGLWDKDEVFDYKLKNSKSVFIPYPTITIMGGDTATGFADAFPPETLTQGFFARLLLVYGEPTGLKVFPIPEPDARVQKELVQLLHRIRNAVVGEITETLEATALLKHIYDTWQPMEDIRFESYAGRRLTHLIKLCLVVVANRVATVIDVQDIIYANTILTFTERLMPRALGEFGKARHSAIMHKIMGVIDKAGKDAEPITLQEIWKVVVSDLENRNQLSEMLASLQLADKIQPIHTDKLLGWLPNRKVVNDKELEGTVDWNILTEAERKIL